MTSRRAAVLVASDADLPLAAARCAWGACADAARGGSAVRRIYVEKEAREEFRKLLRQNVQELKLGAAGDAGVDVGPLSDEAAAAAVEERLKEAVARGARLWAGGPRRGALLPPALVENAPADARLCAEDFDGRRRARETRRRRARRRPRRPLHERPVADSARVRAAERRRADRQRRFRGRSGRRPSRAPGPRARPHLGGETMKRILLAAFLLGALASGARADDADKPPPYAPGFKRAFVVVLENADYKQAVKQPFLKQLMKRGATLTNYHAIAHPSQPNYVALIAGATMGITNDERFEIGLYERHLGDLFEAVGSTWTAYAEGWPGHCFRKAASSRYVRKHEPFISFQDIQTVPFRCAQIKEAGELDRDLAAGKLPDFALYSPDMDDDGHNTGVKAADEWLRRRFGPLLDDPKFMKDMLFVVTFDEDSGTPDNHVLAVLVGDSVRPGAKSKTRYDHYSLLRTFEDAFNLGTLHRRDDDARHIDGIWRNQ